MTEIVSPEALAGRIAPGIRANTGFDYEAPAAVPATPQPDAATLASLRGQILDELAEAYPAFARSMREAV